MVVQGTHGVPRNRRDGVRAGAEPLSVVEADDAPMDIQRLEFCVGRRALSCSVLG